MRRIAEEEGGAALLIVIEGAKGPPSAEARATYQSAARGDGKVNAVALVVVQRGLAGRMIRAMAQAILKVVARNKPVRLFGEVEDAAQWVASRVGQRPEALIQRAHSLRTTLER
ncbi:MAG: hypothetical protein AAGE52_26260 [Myxococcota bacterium]